MDFKNLVDLGHKSNLRIKQIFIKINKLKSKERKSNNNNIQKNYVKILSY